MRQKINLIRHLGILFLTIVIFFLGVFISNNVENLRVQSLYSNLQEQSLDYQNLLTESNYIDNLLFLKESSNNISCSLIEGTYYTSILNLDNSRLKLENYINTGKVKQEEFSLLKSRYLNVQINYWMLANKINLLCNSSMNTILYFYADDKKCPQCQDQGVYLNYVKQKLGDKVLIFSLDSQKKGPIKLLKQSYEINLNNLPSLIVNDKKLGFSTSNQIFKKLCDNGLKNSKVCKS